MSFGCDSVYLMKLNLQKQKQNNSNNNNNSDPFPILMNIKHSTHQDWWCYISENHIKYKFQRIQIPKHPISSNSPPNNQINVS